MEFKEEIEECIQELNTEFGNFNEAKDPGTEVEALKEMLDVFMNGTQTVRAYLDRYNERRFRL
ncbi:MAG: hypothetical protein VX667_01155 [Nitrospinota bacterium]|nr:hypothetical protein [Nitrospinota bacterium]